MQLIVWRALIAVGLGRLVPDWYRRMFEPSIGVAIIRGAR